MIFNKDSLRDYKITKLLPNFKIFCVLTSTFSTITIGEIRPNMRVFKEINPLKEFVWKHKLNGQIVGLVPTMGALHEGHMTLIERSRKQDDLTVCSIYVNPTQFNQTSDLEKYPRTETEDLALLEKSGCQVVFIPSDQVMYPQEPDMYLDFGKLEQVLEGAHRPGHFKGVGIVVSKLFHIVEPNRAYFGQKDWQQVCIIKRMVRDLTFPLKLEVVSTVRESDGLAMSSRNRRLTPNHRSLAPVLHQTIQQVGQDIRHGKPLHQVYTEAQQHLSNFPEIRLEYLEVVDAENLTAPVEPIGTRPLCICVAAFLGEVRLIDNIQIFEHGATELV